MKKRRKMERAARASNGGNSRIGTKYAGWSFVFTLYCKQTSVVVWVRNEQAEYFIGFSTVGK